MARGHETTQWDIKRGRVRIWRGVLKRRPYIGCFSIDRWNDQLTHIELSSRYLYASFQTGTLACPPGSPVGKKNQARVCGRSLKGNIEDGKYRCISIKRINPSCRGSPFSDFSGECDWQEVNQISLLLLYPVCSTISSKFVEINLEIAACALLDLILLPLCLKILIDPETDPISNSRRTVARLSEPWSSPFSDWRDRGKEERRIRHPKIRRRTAARASQ
jgi:hypothetical protein